MANNISPQNVNANQLISAMLKFRLNTDKLAHQQMGLGNNTSNKQAILSTRSGLRRNSSRLLEQLSPGYQQDIAKETLSGNKVKSIKLDENMKNYIKSFEPDPSRQDALLSEFRKRAPFISDKIDRSLTKAPHREEQKTAQKTLEGEIKKCRQVIQARIEKENKLLSQKTSPQGIEYRGHDVPVTVNGKSTGVNATIYEKLEMDTVHDKMQQHYIDASKTKFNSLETVANMGSITPATLLAILLDKSSHNDFTLASKIGVTDLLKEHSLAKFNQYKAGVQKTTQSLNTRLTDYLNITNGKTQLVGKGIEQAMSQQQEIGMHL